jgi:hypothetical protein
MVLSLGTWKCPRLTWELSKDFFKPPPCTQLGFDFLPHNTVGGYNTTRYTTTPDRETIILGVFSSQGAHPKSVLSFLAKLACAMWPVYLHMFCSLGYEVLAIFKQKNGLGKRMVRLALREWSFLDLEHTEKQDFLNHEKVLATNNLVLPPLRMYKCRRLYFWQLLV